MLKFFRSIRQKLLSENKYNKYFKYAIGEIFLVVVGILIALQINNWNQNRLLTNQEHKLLLELKTDLEITQNELALDLFYGDSLYNIGEKLNLYLDTITPDNYQRQMFIDSFSVAAINVKLYPRTIAYENLKSLGVEIIKNDSIRNLILDIFDRRIPRVQYWERSNADREIELNNFMAESFESIKSEGEGLGIYYFMIPNTINSELMLEFKNRLSLMQHDRKMTHNLYVELDTHISNLLSLLEQHYKIE